MIDEYVPALLPALRQLHADGDVDNCLRLVTAITAVLEGDATVRTAATLMDVGDELCDAATGPALSCLAVARDIFETEDSAHGTGSCDVLAAQLTEAAGGSEQAAQLYERGLDLIDEDADAHLAGRGWHNYAILLRGLGRLDEAVAADRRALACYRETGLGAPTGDCHVGIGIAVHHLGRPEDALEPFAAARALFIEFDEQALLADVDDRRGLALCDLGRYEEAAEAHAQAAQRYAAIGAAWPTARSHRYRSHPLDHLGRQTEALEALHEARRVFADADDEVQVALCDSASAAALINLGQELAARPLLDGARRTLQAHGLDTEAEWCADLLDGSASLTHGHP